LNHSLLFFTYYFFSYMLYNFKWFENFQVCRQFALMNESKDTLPFWTFFHTNVSLWSAAPGFLQGPKKEFLWIWKLICSCNPFAGNFWKFFHVFSSQYTTKSYGYMCLEIFIKKLVLILEMAILECFCCKDSHSRLGVKD